MKLIPLFLLTLAVGCSTQPKKIDYSEQVISRIDSLSERPDWFKESESFKITDGEVYSLGSTSIPAEHRLESAIRIAQSNAKASICSAIEQKLEYFFQNAEEGTTLDTNQVRFIGSEACKLSSSSLKNDKVYWEKVSSIKNSGDRQIEYRVFATVKMNESELKTAILEAIKKREGKAVLSKSFLNSVENNWEKLTTGE